MAGRMSAVLTVVIVVLALIHVSGSNDFWKISNSLNLLIGNPSEIEGTNECIQLNRSIARCDANVDYVFAVCTGNKHDIVKMGKGEWSGPNQDNLQNCINFIISIWPSGEHDEYCLNTSSSDLCCSKNNCVVMKWSMYTHCTDEYRCHTHCIRVCGLVSNQAGNCASGKCTCGVCSLGQCELRLNSTRCECTPTDKNPVCQCRHGYPSNQTNCQDVDQCLQQPPRCDHNCTNTDGSFYCWCRPGYLLDTSDNTTCHDINECKNSTLCDYNCTNTNGSYYCTCPLGYQLNTTDNITCHDINECKNSTLCDYNCTNTNGSYYCTCPLGYHLNTTDNKTCNGASECLDEHHECDHNCINTNGSYYCTCRTGYHLNTTDKSCHDINECDNTTLCQHRCHNTPGSYFCACLDGYQTGPDGHSCVRRNSSHVCPCKCSSKQSQTHQQAEKDAHIIKKQLSVVTRDLSTFTRKKTSADDPRHTAKTAGYFGAAILIINVGVIVLPDLIQLFQYLWKKIN